MLEKALESPLGCEEIKPVNPRGNQSWIFIGRIDAEAEAPVFWLDDMKSQLIRKDWHWERLKAREGNDRGWDGWMASLTQWTGVSASSGSWWWTGKPGILQSMGSQRVGHDWATERLNWPELKKAAFHWSFTLDFYWCLDTWWVSHFPWQHLSRFLALWLFFVSLWKFFP